MSGIVSESRVKGSHKAPDGGETLGPSPPHTSPPQPSLHQCLLSSAGKLPPKQAPYAPRAPHFTDVALPHLPLPQPTLEHVNPLPRMQAGPEMLMPLPMNKAVPQAICFVWLHPIFHLHVSVSSSSSGLTLGLVTCSLITVTRVTRPRLAQTSGLISDLICISVSPHPDLQLAVLILASFLASF